MEDLPTEHLILDIGSRTIAAYAQAIAQAATVFVNGPPGAYENPNAEAEPRPVAVPGEHLGVHRHRWRGHRVERQALHRHGRIDVVSTGGGALIRYLSGKPLPLIEAMRAAAERFWAVKAG